MESQQLKPSEILRTRANNIRASIEPLEEYSIFFVERITISLPSMAVGVIPTVKEYRPFYERVIKELVAAMRLEAEALDKAAELEEAKEQTTPIPAVPVINDNQ